MNHRRSALAWQTFIATALMVGSVGCVAVGPGCGGVVGCGCEPGCAVDPGCAVEPGCGCATPCGPNGCSYAGQKWCEPCNAGCGTCKPLINVCTGPCGCDTGCEPGCGCEPSCGVGGCGGTCGCGGCVGENLAFGLQAIGAEFRRVGSRLGLCCPNGGCGGCGDLYWSEWHSDPPACQDPCDNCGNWVGPTGVTSQNTPPADFAPRRIAEHPELRGTVLR